MNVVLIGYRGTGKSCVARRVAALLGLTPVDTDAEVVRASGFTIPEIVAREGWDRFREMETEAVKTLATQDNLCIATGGGVVTRDENVAALRANGRLVWLKAKPETVVKRIRDDSQRPSLTGDKSFLEEVEQVLEVRTRLYRAAAHFEVDTDDRNVEEVAAEVVRLVTLG